MTTISSLLNPPQVDPTKKDSYQFNNDVFEILKTLEVLSNPSVTDNANFVALASHGFPSVTTDIEISDQWSVYGAANASFEVSPQLYAANSQIKSLSPHYLHVTVATHNGDEFYFYQRQPNSVRFYQQSFLTFGMLVKNNQDTAIKVRPEIFSFYDPSSVLKSDRTIYLQPGLNSVSSTIRTDSLRGVAVGASPYTEFRIAFVDLIDGTADLEFYQIKCEFGNHSTLLQQI